MPNTWFNAGKSEVANGGINLLTDTLKIMLVTPSYSFNPDHAFISDLGATELSGTGYVAGFGGAGRKTLAGKTVTRDNVNDRAVFDANDLVWTAINAGTIGGIVMVKEITNDAASKLIAYMVVSPSYTTLTFDVSITWDATGILWLT